MYICGVWDCKSQRIFYFGKKIRSPDLLMTSLICIEREYPSASPVPTSFDQLACYAEGSYLNTLRYFLPSLAQTEILIRQIGQKRLVSATCCLKQGMHRACLHGNVTGRTKIHMQIGQLHSERRGLFTSSFESDAILFRYERSFLVR